jgi:hypothetical protein
MEKHPLIKARELDTDLPVILRGKVAKNHPLKRLLQQVPQTFSTQGKIEYGLSNMHISIKAEDKTLIDCGTLVNPILLNCWKPAFHRLLEKEKIPSSMRT